MSSAEFRREFDRYVKGQRQEIGSDEEPIYVTDQPYAMANGFFALGRTMIIATSTVAQPLLERYRRENLSVSSASDSQ